jgi:alpha-beta hydrolase superfamily lysophospholipase
MESLAVPTVVVLTGQGKAHNIRRVVARACASVRNVRVEVLPGASHHTIPAEHAGPLSARLLDFLAGQRAAQRA